MEEKKLTVRFEQYDHWQDLPESVHELVHVAEEARNTAYAPYSKFHVGASLRLSNGQVVSGSNQENVAYPSGLCAERVALFYAGANYADEQIETLCVVAKGDLLPVDQILSPCGACRQVMMETEARQAQTYRIILVSQNGITIVFNSARDLLPLAFGLKNTDG